jgi:hypothetical protein
MLTSLVNVVPCFDHFHSAFWIFVNDFEIINMGANIIVPICRLVKCLIIHAENQQRECSSIQH